MRPEAVPWKVVVLLAWTGVAGLSACGESQRPMVDPVAPSFDMDPCDGSIYDPCSIDGFLVVWHRQPADPPFSPPDTVPCSLLTGGCFPPGQPPIVGGGPYWGYTGAPYTVGQAAAAHGWSGISPLSSIHRAQVQMAIRQLQGSYPGCSAIASELSARVTSGGLWEGYNPYDNGEWAREVGGGGLIFINTTPGFDIWDQNGMYNAEELRQLLAHEGIHMWFDSDVGHGGGVSDDQQRAFDEMREACGTW
jgi:hypothetical protein